MSASTKEIDLALVDVRKAYRLLHDYQRAALDAAKYIGSQIGFTYRGGYPLFSNCAPREGGGKLDNWSWDWLNLVFYDFHFNNDLGAKHFNLSIWLFSDTGFYASKDAKVDPLDVATFAPAEVSETKVGFLLYRTWDNKYNQFRANRDEVLRFLEGGELPTALKDGGIVGKCCPFARLSDEESSDIVIAELVQLAVSKGFPMELINKSV